MPNKRSKQWEEEVMIEATVNTGGSLEGARAFAMQQGEGRGLHHRKEHSLSRELGWKGGLEQGKLQAESPIPCSGIACAFHSVSRQHH